MTTEQLRKAHQAQPFIPFAIRTADGRTFRVGHPEFLAYGGGRTCAVWDGKGAFDIIDLLLVTSLDLSERPARTRRKSA
jgi:hypothetical protein